MVRHTGLVQEIVPKPNHGLWGIPTLLLSHSSPSNPSKSSLMIDHLHPLDSSQIPPPISSDHRISGAGRIGIRGVVGGGGGKWAGEILNLSARFSFSSYLQASSRKAHSFYLSRNPYKDKILQDPASGGNYGQDTGTS